MYTQFYALQISASIGRTMAISPYMWPHLDPYNIAIIYTYTRVMASTLVIQALAVDETHIYIHARNNCNIYKHIYNYSNNFLLCCVEKSTRACISMQASQLVGWGNSPKSLSYSRANNSTSLRIVRTKYVIPTKNGDPGCGPHHIYTRGIYCTEAFLLPRQTAFPYKLLN